MLAAGLTAGIESHIKSMGGEPRVAFGRLRQSTPSSQRYLPDSGNLWFIRPIRSGGAVGSRTGHARRWRFHISGVRRVRTVVRLQRDLGSNLAGAALALELPDRVEKLQRQL